MDFPVIFKLDNENDTKKIAKDFAKKIKKGDVILLNGDLGTGKTFFVKSVCEFFNIDSVTSPTFSLVNQYYGDYLIYHIDFYRIEKSDELQNIGLDEYLYDSDAVKFIEWSDLFSGHIHTYNFRIDIRFITPAVRELKIS